MKNTFGGALLRNKRKDRRPLQFDKATHITLRLRALLPPFFDPHDHELRGHFFRLAQKYNVRIYDLIFNHTHMHAALLLHDRQSYARFIREVTSFMTYHFSKNLERFGVKLRKLLSYRPFTRVVPWGRAYERLECYLRKNELESGVRQEKWNENLREQNSLKFRDQASFQLQMNFDDFQIKF